MKKHLLLYLVASLASGATILYAKEDHRPYRSVKLSLCNDCHRDANVPANHQAAWNTEHRLPAVKANATCGDCHDQQFCMDCHYGGGLDADLRRSNTRGPDYKPKSHRAAWQEEHPIFAWDNPASCRRCHNPSFCSNCHAQFQPQDLMFQSHRKGWSGQSPHNNPNVTVFTCQTCHPNSVLPTNVWSSSHAREARQNLATCQSCHPDGSTCLTCHSATSGLRINPHPGNWGKIQGNLNRAAGKRTCVKCH